VPCYALTAFRMVLSVPAYIVGLFVVKRTGYGAIGIIYGILATAVRWIAAAGLRKEPGPAVTDPLLRRGLAEALRVACLANIATIGAQVQL